ncbi:MAG: hypothetical protein PT944_03865 [Actinomycetaceae bacterium]|nr:hypothetical protein [Arcanobacterium sp.]MDD7687040.1 hypothetical protein [Actinomycetaceae bacterium]MDY5273303.1 hypothetical protein [Arcanobacterium sp.]
MSFFGINGAEFLVLLVVVIVVLGPSRTAQALVAIQHGVTKMRGWSAQLREQLSQLREQEQAAEDSALTDLSNVASATDSLATATADINSALRELDPTQLDPRKMIKEAVAEEMKAWMETAHISGMPSEKQQHENH